METQSLVSIIINTKNEEKRLEACLRSIREQDYFPIELVVIDNFSQDQTPQIAHKYAQVFLQKGPERNIQRNFGAKNAQGKYLLFVDADMELTKKVVSDCVDLVQSDPETKVVIIPEESFGEGFWVKCKALERSTYIGDDSIEAARFFEKDVFLKLGGFDPKLIAGEDWDLSSRARLAGYKIGRISSLIRHNEGKLSLIKTMKKKFYYGTKISGYLAKRPAGIASQVSFLRPAYFRHWKRLIKDPLHTLGFLLMKSCEFAAGGTGLLTSKLKHE